MRPISSVRSVLRYPLNEIMGAEANVRLLRVLADEVDGPLSTPDMAERAGLSMMGARKALEKLVNSGFVEFVGGGRKQLYALRRSGSLAAAIADLFSVERRRYEGLIASLKKEAQHLSPPPVSVWIHNSPMQFGDPLVVGILDDTKTISVAVADAEERFVQIEKEFDVTVEISGYTRADLPNLDPEKIALLAGVPPAISSTNSSRRKPGSHQEVDQRARNWTETLIPLIQEDPSLVRRACKYLDRLLETDQAAANHDLNEWQNILESYPRRRLLQFLRSSTPRACRLRQSNPFFAVLSPTELARLQDMDQGDAP